jgi:hypothetical protein
MFERILFVVSDKADDKRFVLELAQRHSSMVVLMALVGTETPEKQRSAGATHKRVLREDRERKGWQTLYHLEEEFKAAGVRASVMVHVGTVADIDTVGHNTRADIIVLPASLVADTNYHLPDEFIPQLPCPIVILNTH